MDLHEFRETLEVAREAHNWRPIGEHLLAKLHQQVVGANGIGVDAYLKLLGDFIAKPSQTPAHLLSDIKGERRVQLQTAEQKTTGKFTGYGKMTPEQQSSYRATIQRVKGELADDLVRLHSEGRIPTWSGDGGPGLNSIGSLLSATVLRRGLDELALERGLADAE